MKIPKKYEAAVREIYQDDDGIWCELNSGWCHGVDRTHVIHCETYGELRREMAEIKEET